MRWRRSGGRLALLISLMGALLSGCATRATALKYTIQIPLLGAAPDTVSCRDRRGITKCIVMREDDYRALVRELKAACLANGQSKAECQTE